MEPCALAFARGAERLLAGQMAVSAVAPASAEKAEVKEDRKPHPGGRGLIYAAYVASLLKVSSRTVWRLNDAGRIPQPVRIGSLVRWNHREFVEWLAAKCPPREQRGTTKGKEVDHRGS